MTKYENNIKASVKNVIITVFFPTPTRFSIAYIQPVNLGPLLDTPSDGCTLLTILIFGGSVHCLENLTDDAFA